MATLKKFYKKYKSEFKKLEKRSNTVYSQNPYNYEQGVGLGWAPDRDGQQMFEEPKQTKALTLYWEQRDKIDDLLSVDQSFQEFISNKNYLEETEKGLDAFFSINFYAIKNKIYN